MTDRTSHERVPLRIVQITDCHLFATPERELRGVATWPRFTSVLEAIANQVPEFDLLVITGDTAHDEVAATYEAVRKTLGEWAPKVRTIPGNHDDRSSLRQAFSESACAAGECDGRVTFHERRADWRLIGLDSQITGQVPGRLGDEQLAWLQRELDADKDRPTALFLHHPPISVRSAWLDAIRLQDHIEVEALLRAFPQVRLVCCGHVHQAVTGSLAGASVFTTPAVGLQFRPRTEQMEIDPRPPAFRVLELFPDGRWSTQVLHCEG